MDWKTWVNNLPESTLKKTLSEIINDYNDIILEYPDIFNSEWNNPIFVSKNFSDLSSLCIYHSFFGEERVKEKLYHSEELSKLLQWEFPITTIIDQCQILYSKYPEIITDQFLSVPIDWVIIKTNIFLNDFCEGSKQSSLVDLNNKIDTVLRIVQKSRKLNTKYNFSEFQKYISNTFVIDKSPTKGAPVRSFDLNNPIDHIIFQNLMACIKLYSEMQDFNTIKKIAKSIFQPDIKEHIKLIRIDKNRITDKNQFYLDFFDYIKFVLRTDTIFRTEEEFLKADTGTYDGKYRNYKIATSKILLGHTKSRN